VIKLTLAEVVGALNARPGGDVPALSVGGVSTDSRTTRAGDLFVAIPGERFDGHDFVAEAARRGAVAVVVAEARASAVAERLRAAEPRPAREPLLLAVDDTVAALGRLAAYHRRQTAAAVIAVVGSNGKTTTKAMIHHILSGRRPGRCSPKSFNNQIGVPLTLLSAEPGDEYLVVEIGTNAPGEVAALAAIAAPDLAVITGIGEEHLEKLGDLEGVAAEECAILARLRPQGFAAVNGEAPQIRPHLVSCTGVTVATFGRTADADVRVTDVRYEDPWLHFRINERFPLRLRLAGAHNALNAAGAVTVARRLGVDFDEAAVRLETFVPPPMRNEILDIGPITVINDAYNANPQSAAAAIETLRQMPCRGRRIAVFGEMRELGAQAAALHRRVGALLRGSGIERVVLVGAATEPMYAALTEDGLFGPAVERCADVAECGRRLAASVAAGDVVLLKASRAVELDRVVEALRASGVAAVG